jgi:hypothetical protein
MMDSIYMALAEAVVLLVISLPSTYLFWRFNRSKMSFWDYLNKYGYGIAYLCVLVFVVFFILAAYWDL